MGPEAEAIAALASEESPETGRAIRDFLSRGAHLSRRLLAKTLLNALITGRPICCATHWLSGMPRSIASMGPSRSCGKGADAGLRRYPCTVSCRSGASGALSQCPHRFNGSGRKGGEETAPTRR